MIHAFVINLPEAEQRLTAVKQYLDTAGIPFTVVKAIRGSDIPYPTPLFDEISYRLLQGRRLIAPEVGCYLSHIKAIKQFLATGASHGLILEDDATFGVDLATVIREAMKHADAWDILRLNSVNSGRWTHSIPLTRDYGMGISFTREKGAGGYILSRKAALKMRKSYLPMRLPYDHRFDIEWIDGLKAMGVTPPPIRQADFATQIQRGVRGYYYSPWVRYWTVFPARMLIEMSRVVFRFRHWCALKLFTWSGPGAKSDQAQQSHQHPPSEETPD